MSDQQQPSVQQELPLDAFGQVDAEAAILQRWEDPQKEVSENEAEATPDQLEETEQEQVIEEEELEDEEAESDSDLEEEAEEEPEEDEDEEVIEQEELSDDTLVDIVVDGETQQASIAALKRLHGQEQSLTRKSQETARLRKEAESSIEKTHAIMQRMLEQAQERAKPYKEVDMMLASKQLSNEDFAQLRKEAKEAEDNLKFLTEEADSFYRDMQQKQQANLQQAATECVKVLQQEVPDWSNNLYNDIRAYAVGQGLQQEEVDQYVDPVVIQILRKSMLYDQGKQVATTKKRKPQKRVLKSKKAPPTKQAVRSQREKELAAKAASSSDPDDAIALIMSRWEE